MKRNSKPLFYNLKQSFLQCKIPVLNGAPRPVPNHICQERKSETSSTQRNSLSSERTPQIPWTKGLNLTENVQIKKYFATQAWDPKPYFFFSSNLILALLLYFQLLAISKKKSFRSKHAQTALSISNITSFKNRAYILYFVKFYCILVDF